MTNPDTLTILKTMRAVVADVEPERFDMGVWFDWETRCGCIIGLSLVAQPKFADNIGIHLGEHSRSQLRMRGVDFRADVGAFEEIAWLLGITADESRHLFDWAEYIDYSGCTYGEAGKAEALRRLDAIIAKYSKPEDGDGRILARQVAELLLEGARD